MFSLSVSLFLCRARKQPSGVRQQLLRDVDELTEDRGPLTAYQRFRIAQLLPLLAQSLESETTALHLQFKVIITAKAANKTIRCREHSPALLPFTYFLSFPVEWPARKVLSDRDENGRGGPKVW